MISAAENCTSSHLPECPYVVFDQQGQIPATVIPRGCICHALRACEQRMYDWSKSFGVGKTFYDAGRADGLDAAREAVRESVGPGADAFSLMVFGRALDAIDALKEKNND